MVTMVSKYCLILLCAVVVNLFIAPLCRSDVSPVPAGEAEAKAALEKSPRHHEWVNVPVPGSETKLSFLVKSGPALSMSKNLLDTLRKTDICSIL
jgi:hypothetical protein